MIHADFSELTKYRAKIGDAPVDQTMRAYLSEVSEYALRETILLTPVRTGTLRREWKLTKMSQFKRGSNTIFDIWLFNDTSYAMYVEYGHRTRRGKTGLRRWITGQYMMRSGCGKVNVIMPRLMKKYLDAFYKSIGGK